MPYVCVCPIICYDADILRLSIYQHMCLSSKGQCVYIVHTLSLSALALPPVYVVLHLIVFARFCTALPLGLHYVVPAKVQRVNRYICYHGIGSKINSSHYNNNKNNNSNKITTTALSNPISLSLVMQHVG